MRSGRLDRLRAPSLTALVLAGTAILGASAPPALAEGASAALFVPIVLSSSGAGGSFFTSELTLSNRGSTTAAVELRYTAAFGGGEGSCSETLLPGEQMVIADAIAHLHGRGVPLPPSGNRGGTLNATFTGLSAPDAAAVTVRTTTGTAPPLPSGAAGLAYPGVLPSSGTTTEATLYGLRATSKDRSNVAVYNPASEPVTVRVTVHSGNGSGTSFVKESALDLPAFGWQQVSFVFDGTGISDGWVTVEKTGGAGVFGAYAVVNCNGTSDGSFVPATLAGASGSRITVPVLVETTSGFVSELVLANRSASDATLTLDYVESLATTPAHGTASVTLRAREQLILPDALDYLRDIGIPVGKRGAANYAGALRISVAGAALADVFAGARTASLCPAGGQFGLFTPGVYEGMEASTEALLYGLRADAFNRTNVAVLNAGGDGAGPVTLELQAYDGNAGGAPRGSPEAVSLEPGAWHQYSGFLGSRGVGNGWVRVARTSGTAPWIAYGVVNDGGAPGERTGDGAYVAMVAAAEAAPCTWELSTLHESVSAYSPILAYDPDGQPAIGYEVLGSQPQTKLGRWSPETSSWNVQGSIPGRGGFLGFDPADGHPTFISSSSVTSSGTLDLAHWTGSSWKVETVDGRLDLYNFTSAAFGSDGAPSVSYTPQEAGLRFATKNGSTWTAETVDPNGGWFNSLAYDPDGNPAIAYSVGGTEVVLARRRGGAWEIESLASKPGESTVGWYLDLTFDPSGRPAIAHRVRGVGVELIRWDGHEWHREIVATESKTILGVSLAFDLGGRPFVSFGSSGRLWIAERTTDGTWHAEPFDQTDSVSSTWLARDSSGQLAASYSRTVQGARGIGFARRTCP